MLFIDRNHIGFVTQINYYPCNVVDNRCNMKYLQLLIEEIIGEIQDMCNAICTILTVEVDERRIHYDMPKM